MKQIILTLLLAFSLFSCERHLDDVIPHEELQNSVSNQDNLGNLRSITPDQAKLFAEKVYEGIHSSNIPGIKKDETNELIVRHQNVKTLPDVSSVHKIKKNGITTLYIVNFGRDDGYVILTADKSQKWALLLYNDFGNISLDDIKDENPFSLWIKDQSNQSYKNITNPTLKIPDEMNELWEAFSTPLQEGETLEITLSTVQKTKVDETELRGTHKGSWGLSGVAPYYSVRQCLWGQGSGYNADAKIPNALAGCPAVAIGLYCKTKRMPDKYDYSEMPEKLSTSSSNAISRMFRDIADNIPNYKWGIDGSGALPYDILTGLKNIGFKQAKLDTYNFKTVYNQIKAFYPVLLAGYSNRGGHIWISDGYWEQEWTVTRKFLWWKIKSWTEYSDMLYMNWGWNGSGNGWVDQADWTHFSSDRRMYYDIKP